MSKFPPFILDWIEIEKRRVGRWARHLLATADQAVRARDAEIAQLRRRVQTLEQLHAVTEDRDVAFSDYLTWDFDGRKAMGLHILWEDKPQRLATLQPGDRVVVLRAKSRIGRCAIPSDLDPPGAPPVAVHQGGAA